MGSDAQPVLEVEGLSIDYRTEAGTIRAVDGVTLALRRGEVLGLVGESGSGKSTIASAVIRLLAANATVASGRILLAGENLLEKSEVELREIRGNRLAIVFQNPLTSLTPSLRVGEQIAEIVRVHKQASREAAFACAIELLARVGLPDPATRARSYPHQLSGGMQQRAMIACALACDPDVLIMDEPTTALDVTTEANILDLVAELKQRVNAGILYITHDLGVVARVCDRLAVLYASQVVEQGSVEELFYAPKHPYTIGLLASVPRPTPARTGKKLAAIPGRIPTLGSTPTSCAFGPRCPFACNGCEERVQTLQAIDASRQTRCERHAALTGVAWPAPVSDAAVMPTTTEMRVVQAEDLTLIYRADGWLAGVRLARGGPLGLRLARDDAGVLAVDGVSVALCKGETLGLVGESGSGKSTLGRMLVKLLDPTRGRVLVESNDIAQFTGAALRACRKSFQIVFQNPESSLNPRHLIADILARPLLVHRLATAETVAQRVCDLLRIVQLPIEYAERYPHQLSGGEKQRVGIARAIATEPRFIVCDEPVTALDVSVRASILNLLTDLQARLGLTYLFIAHDLSVVRQVADRVAVMYLGRICESGLVDDVFAPPHHPYTRALLSAIPVPDPRIARSARRLRLPDPSGAPTTWSGCNFYDRCPVRINGVCDRRPPTLRTPKAGHSIYCHHDLAALQAQEAPARELARTEAA